MRVHADLGGNRALALLCALVVLTGIDARTDLAALWYRTDPRSLSPIPTPADRPSSWAQLLHTTSFDKLSPPLQRALVWESGLVRVAGQSAAYAQVYVRSGYSMSNVFILKPFIDESTCPLKVCNANSQNYALASQCDPQHLLSKTLCGVVDDVPGTIETASSYFWGQAGDIGDDDIVLFKFTPAATTAKRPNATNSFFTIHQGKNKEKADSPCANAATFVVPCVRLTKADLNNDAGTWSTPDPSDLIGVWVRQEIQAATKKSGSRELSATSIALVIAVAVLGLLVVVLSVVLFRRTRAAKQPAMTPGVIQSGGQSNNAPRPTSGPRRSQPTSSQYCSAGSDPENMSSREIEAFNDALCRRSQHLAEFVQDQSLLIKRIAYSSITFLRRMARGANGEVWRGECEGQIVAVKRLLPDIRDDVKVMGHFVKEIRLASGLDHPNVVRFVGLAWRTLPELCIVSEFMPGGDLAHFLGSKAGKAMEWKDEKIRLAIDIANSLVYLHSLVPVIVHRDLKSLNILLSADLQAKISDFGLSRERSIEETMTSGIGTILWTAPEVLRGDRYSEKADIYSFGVVLSELDTCLPPYSLNQGLDHVKSKSMHLMPMIKRGAITPAFSPTCPPLLLELATSCLAMNPDKRPNAMQIVYLLRSKIQPTL